MPSLDSCERRFMFSSFSFDVKLNSNMILLCNPGPISEPSEAEYVLKRTNGVHGFYGASSLERLPVEQAITGTVKQYKSISIS